ncbi:MAG: T9SS type A sorting domain-containing protein [Ignavibacteriaceae bacterium]|nr:T9SS type A sorting domain-containing protein [Ignavibacteriaceae bacterium]
MKKLSTHLQVILTIQVIILLNINLFGQLSAPAANAIYGGTIRAISVISTGGSSSKIFVATESANSVFFANITTTSGSEGFGTFTVMPGLGSDDGYGSTTTKIYAHQVSQYLFFINNNTLYKTHFSGSTVTQVEGAAVLDFIIYGNYIFYIKGSDFYYGQIDASGNVVNTGSFSIGLTLTSPSIQVNPSNSKVYITTLTATPVIRKSSVNYDALSGSSSFSTLPLGALSGSVTSWDAFGIGPDGTLFLGGDDNSNKYVQSSTNDGTNWGGGSTLINGIGGPNFSFAGASSPYKVCFSKCYSTFTTSTGFGAWAEFGNVSSETHPNDGSVFVDPNNSAIIYLTTDQGIGATINGGANVVEIDNGIEAVQVNDFSMKSDKDMAWLASKAGVRKVTSFATTPVWTNAIFPNNDGAPYYSAEMENDNDATAYVGNVRIYKTTNSGSAWSQVLSEGTTGYPQVGSRAEAIEVCPTNSSLVLAGFYVDGTIQGGLWYSTNAGTNWSQLQLRSGSTLPNDVDVYDIVFTTETNPVAYIGVYYDLSIGAPGDRGYSIYRAEWNGSSWSVRQDMQGTYTSTGSVIVVTIIDLEVNSGGTIIYACGTDAAVNHPVAYYKDLSGTNLWTVMPVTGFPSGNQTGKAIASGGGAIYCAVDNIIYTIPTAGTEWSVGYTYPTGTEINVLFYDALLAGTGTGLYDHSYSALPVELTSFNAHVNGANVLLNWNTATELNNFGFDIERQVNSRQSAVSNWEKIGFVNGNGNSNSPKDYSFVDKSVLSGKYSYRLKQIDNDGKYEYSKKIEIDLGMPTEFSLEQNYPNPFNPVTTINFAIPEEAKVTLAVFNQLGERVAVLVNEKLEVGNHSATWNAGNLSSGIYFYEIRTDRFTAAKKLLLLK